MPVNELGKQKTYTPSPWLKDAVKVQRDDGPNLDGGWMK